MKCTIFHNPRCSKSRKTLELLQEKSVEIDTILYLEVGVSENKVLELSKLLNKPVKNFMRKGEQEYKDLDIDIEDNNACAKAIKLAPKILERPIVICGDKAVIGRPPENIDLLF